MEHPIFRPQFDLALFRSTGAMFVKLLIRARWWQEPGFMSADDLKKWGLADIESDRYPAFRLLQEAATLCRTLNTDFIPRCGSGGCAISDESTPEGRLIGSLAFLIIPNEGGPYHNVPLLQAAETCFNGKTLDWENFVQWDKLPTIRSDLDLLPEPSFGHLSNRVVTGPGVDSQVNVFQRRGSQWNLRFEGGEVFALPESVGLFYIQKLLQRPNQTIPSLELSQQYVAFSSSEFRRVVESSDGAADFENVNHADSAGPVLDDDAKRQLRATFTELRQHLAVAKRNNDPGAVDSLQAELDALSEQAKAALKPNGTDRELGSNANKARNRVFQAIDRAKEKIKECSPPLWLHLEQSLKTGGNCMYSPPSPINWQF